MKTIMKIMRTSQAPWRFLVTPAGLVISLVFIFGVYGETVAAYCTQYATDLEKKQAYVSEIKEDIDLLENALAKNTRKGNPGRENPNILKLNRLEITGTELAQLIPPTPRLDLGARAGMCGTLSPEARGSAMKHRKEVASLK